MAEAAVHYGITRQRVCRLIQKGAFNVEEREPRLIRMPRGAVWYLPYPFARRKLKHGRPKQSKQCRKET